MELENELLADYKKRINNVFQYIDEHLDANLSLSVVSEIAHFSPFHFHRVFKTITGETLNEYVTRRRVEQSALDLLHKQTAVTTIALKFGFNDNASFTRAFKKYYGVSPTEFRKQHPNRFSKIRQLQSKNGQVYPEGEKYLRIIDHLKQWTKMNAEIQIKEMPEVELAYVSSRGPANLGGAFERLIRWATPKGYMHAQSTLMTIYHDSFKVTEAHKVRMSACLVLEEPVDVEGDIGLTALEKMKCIVARFEIRPEAFAQSWSGLFIWMNENGYKKADGTPFEIYHNNFNDHPEQIAIVDFCIPIE